MRRTRTLSLSMKQLTAVPDEVFLTAQEESVNTVDCSQNKFATLPEG